MPSLFGVDIAGIIGGALAPGMLDAVLYKKVLSSAPPSRNPTDLAAGLIEDASSPSSQLCKGFVDARETRFGPGGTVIQGGTFVSLFGSTLGGQVPEPGDRILIEGRTYTVVEDGVSSDPAGALYRCRVQV